MIKAISIYPGGDVEKFKKDTKKLWEIIKKEVEKSYIMGVEVEHELLEITNEAMSIVEFMPNGISYIKIRIQKKGGDKE